MAERQTRGKFKIPYINSKYIFPALLIASAAIVQYAFPDFFSNSFDFSGDSNALTANISMDVFFIFCVIMAVIAFIKNLSLIPLLGLVSCCYLLTGMALSNWKWFGLWLLIGLVIYFLYSRNKSKLNTKEA
jgi:hypothetical protein